MRTPSDTLYFDWETYDGGWLDLDKTTRPLMKEFMECFAGKLIATGQDRHVFAHKFDDSLVIKLQTAYGTQNAVECSTWERHKSYPDVAKWLAPVVSRSSSMRVIVQKRTMPMLEAPKQLPNFLTDHKVQNYGLLNNKVVCHDYGLGIFCNDTREIKMENVTWWDVGTQKNYRKRK